MAFVSIFKNPLFAFGSSAVVLYSGYEFYKKYKSDARYVIDDQDGKTFIVTGATSGIGKQLARDLAMKDATVIMACRNKNKCLEVRRDIVLKTRNKKVYCRLCNLEDPASVHNFVQKIAKDRTGDFAKIDGIVFNAATKVKKYKQTGDGIELTLATNHMANFLFAGLMMQKLLEQPGNSRIVFVGTDIAAKDNLNLQLDKLNEAKYYIKMFKKATEEMDLDKGKYDMHCAYKYSKLMQLLFARELAERVKDSKIDVLVADPGGTKTQLNKEEDSQKWFLTRWCANLVGFLMGARRKPEDAVGPILYALCDPDMQHQNGTFISSRRKPREWGANAENSELRQMVWLMTEKWTKLGEHMQRMEEELVEPGYYAYDTSRPNRTTEKEPRKRSAKYLWLA